ncbi:FkbM family methyltransferase [Streptomyces sp. NPDC050535]|uniref:FkbM family methyltransferase n=1 Tax=Streptomyces sp. NPDC050535 TaxID=3365626 RepID=UPI0037BA9FCD
MISILNRREADYLYKEIFEDESYIRASGITLPSQPIIFDVGANIGIFSLFAAQSWPAAKIYAFEPVPEIFKILRENVRTLPDVTLYNSALGEKTGTKDITYYPRYTMLSGFNANKSADRTIVAQYIQNSFDEVTDPEVKHAVLSNLDGLLDGMFEQQVTPVTVDRISNVVRHHNLNRIDLLKIDVEGSEMQVIKGIDEEIWPLLGNVVVEVADHNGGLLAMEREFHTHGMEIDVQQMNGYRGTNLYLVFAGR